MVRKRRGSKAGCAQVARPHAGAAWQDGSVDLARRGETGGTVGRGAGPDGPSSAAAGCGQHVRRWLRMSGSAHHRVAT